jgi:hypothetical protein
LPRYERFLRRAKARPKLRRALQDLVFRCDTAPGIFVLLRRIPTDYAFRCGARLSVGRRKNILQEPRKAYPLGLKARAVREKLAQRKRARDLQRRKRADSIEGALERFADVVERQVIRLGLDNPIN